MNCNNCDYAFTDTPDICRACPFDTIIYPPDTDEEVMYILE